MIRNIVFTVLLIPYFVHGQSSHLMLNAEQFNGIDKPAVHLFQSPHQVKIPRIIKLLAGRTSIDFVYLSVANSVCAYYPISQEHIFLFKTCLGDEIKDANTWIQTTHLKLYFNTIDSRINLKQAEALIEYKPLQR